MTTPPGGAASAGPTAADAPPPPKGAEWEPYRPLWIGLLLSLAVHLPVLFAGAWQSPLPRLPVEIEVTLPPQARTPAPDWLARARRQAATPLPSRPHRATTVHRQPQPPMPPDRPTRLIEAPLPQLTDAAAAPATGENALPLPDLPAVGTGDGTAAAAAVQAAVPVPVAEPSGDQEPLAGLPSEGEVDYRVTKGSGEWRSGRGTLRWRVDHDHYRLDLEAHAEGLPALVWWSGVHWSSEGRIGSEHLQPELFMKNARDGVRFDWTAHRLTFLPSGFVRPLPDGGQDLLSVFFQFALRPPADDGMDFPVTNGDKVDRYAFELTERERLKLDLGEVDTIHISRIHKLDENGFEIWLAQDRNFLPVQMRLYHSRLGVLNLYATGIRVNGLHGRLQEH